MTTTDNPKRFGIRAATAKSASASAIGESRMYYAITTTFAALMIFVPTFIGLRDRTNADWRSR